jgi:hypothetical protein
VRQLRVGEKLAPQQRILVLVELLEARALLAGVGAVGGARALDKVLVGLALRLVGDHPGGKRARQVLKARDDARVDDIARCSVSRRAANQAALARERRLAAQLAQLLAHGAQNDVPPRLDLDEVDDLHAVVEQHEHRALELPLVRDAVAHGVELLLGEQRRLENHARKAEPARHGGAEARVRRAAADEVHAGEADQHEAALEERHEVLVELRLELKVEREARDREKLTQLGLGVVGEHVVVVLEEALGHLDGERVALVLVLVDVGAALHGDLAVLGADDEGDAVAQQRDLSTLAVGLVRDDEVLEATVAQRVRADVGVVVVAVGAAVELAIREEHEIDALRLSVA